MSNIIEDLSDFKFDARDIVIPSAIVIQFANTKLVQ